MQHTEPRTYRSYQQEMAYHEEWMKTQRQASEEFAAEMSEIDAESRCSHCGKLEEEKCSCAALEEIGTREAEDQC